MRSRQAISESFYYSKTLQPKNTVGKQHYHNLFEIYYLEEGSCHYFIDNDTYEVRAGDVVLIPEGIIHKTVYLDTDAKRRLIYCSPIYIPPAANRYLSSIIYIYRHKRVSHEVLDIINDIEREYSSEDDFSENMILCLMHRLFLLLARNRDAEAPIRNGNSYTTATISYIKENYSEDISLAELAGRCVVTPEHLCRTFKHDTGFSIFEYISIIRLQQAQFLLRSDPSLSVSEVALRCGFNDSNYFSKCFKSALGISPCGFRKAERIKSLD